MTSKQTTNVILVTGASGFIASKIVIRLFEELKQQEERLGVSPATKIRILLRPTSDIFHRIPRSIVSSNFLQVVYGVLQDADDVQKFFITSPNERITHIYHSAASGGDWGKYNEFYDANAYGTYNMVHETIKLWQNPDKAQYFQRFLHVSTVDVYSHNVATKDCHGDLNARLSTNRKYGYTRTKSIGDHLVINAYKKYKFPITIVRPAVVYGAGSYSWGTVESRIIQQGLGFYIGGSNFPTGAVHVDDVVEGCILAARSQNSIGKIYNLSDPNSPTWKEYMDIIAKGIGKTIKYNWPFWFLYLVSVVLEFIYELMGWDEERPLMTLFVLYLAGRPQEWPVKTAEEDFGWKAKKNFQEGMQEQIKWILENEEHLK